MAFPPRLYENVSKICSSAVNILENIQDIDFGLKIGRINVLDIVVLFFCLSIKYFCQYLTDKLMADGPSGQVLYH